MYDQHLEQMCSDMVQKLVMSPTRTQSASAKTSKVDTTSKRELCKGNHYCMFSLPAAPPVQPPVVTTQPLLTPFAISAYPVPPMFVPMAPPMHTPPMHTYPPQGSTPPSASALVYRPLMPGCHGKPACFMEFYQWHCLHSLKRGQTCCYSVKVHHGKIQYNILRVKGVSGATPVSSVHEQFPNAEHIFLTPIRRGALYTAHLAYRTSKLAAKDRAGCFFMNIDDQVVTVLPQSETRILVRNVRSLSAFDLCCALERVFGYDRMAPRVQVPPPKFSFKFADSDNLVVTFCTAVYIPTLLRAKRLIVRGIPCPFMPIDTFAMRL